MVYDVALSFAGEDRKYVDEVAHELHRLGVRVFYDKFETAKLWGKNLYTHLQNVYQKQAKYTVIFISEHYAKKLWTNHERIMAQARAFTESEEYILPARFDDTEIEGIPHTTAYIDLRKISPEEFCVLICEKLEHKPIDKEADKISTGIQAEEDPTENQGRKDGEFTFGADYKPKTESSTSENPMILSKLERLRYLMNLPNEYELFDGSSQKFIKKVSLIFKKGAAKIVIPELLDMIPKKVGGILETTVFPAQEDYQRLEISFGEAILSSRILDIIKPLESSKGVEILFFGSLS